MSKAGHQAAAPPAERTIQPGPVYANILEMIGNTPMLELKQLDTGTCRLFVKMESMNPGNSIKDRIAVYMVEEAERQGAIKPGGRIVEATAGNTGIALALVAGQKGYHVTVVMPDKMSSEKISHLKAMGAEVVLTRSDVGKGHPEYYQDMAERLAEQTPNSVYVNQFFNPANVKAHYETTGPEIWQQMQGQMDAFVAGVGSGGTISGAGKFFREQNPDIELILADPEGSILAPKVNEGKDVEPGSWLIEGIGEDFVPPICDLDLFDRAYVISDQDSFHTCRELLRTEGVLAGSSVGTLLTAALRYCREQTEPKRVVTLICDHGAKYLSKMYNDYWMIDQGFIERESFGDLRDLIARRHTDREDYTLKPSTPLTQAIKMMQMYSISQMAVIDEDDQVVGIIDESDVLLSLLRKDVDSNRPVSDFMMNKLETVSPTDTINEILPLLRSDRVAIVVDDTDGTFYGLITKFDLINYLRAQLP